MKYTLEEIYYLGGKEDKSASVTFFLGTESFRDFGSYVTVEFVYTQHERESLDQQITIEPYTQTGYAKAKALYGKLSADKERLLIERGINSDDIASIAFYDRPGPNTFHSTKERELRKLTIPMRMLPKGGDLEWMYGFKKKMIEDGKKLTPCERVSYLAGKLYFELSEVSESERAEIFPDKPSVMNSAIEEELLAMKLRREEISVVEKTRLGELLQIKLNQRLEKLKQSLIQSGSTLHKLMKTNMQQADYLLRHVSSFQERRLNLGVLPVYLDIDGFLHVYMRHVKQMKVGEQFEDKDNFQWDESDVFTVMGHVIKSVDNEIQEYFRTYPGKRFSRFGPQSIYFQGDYYTLHIDPSGRVSTFHKNRKAHEKPTGR